MAKTTDDLEAVRAVTTALDGFSPEDQERIIRWAREKLGLAPAPRTQPEGSGSPQVPAWSGTNRPAAPPEDSSQPSQAKDVKTFVTAKSPRTDSQFAATVAYFYRFEAPPDKRLNEIDANILQDACRLSSRPRLPKPLVTLNNAKRDGLLDSGSGAGKFTINTVGENLVAMTLPGQAEGSARRDKTGRSRRRVTVVAKGKKQTPHE